MKKQILATSALSFLATSIPALAQDAASEETEAKLDTITITATRREGVAQDIPINVAAIGGAQIEKQGITELSDLIAVVPGINVIDRGPRQGNPIIVRGIFADPVGSGDGNNDGGGTVATYLGDIPLFVDLKLNDMERVEVLLGPQGTLYGAGTLAGAIRYIPVEPQYQEDSIEVRSEFYQYSEADSISTDFGFTFNKAFGDTFALRGSIDFLDDSGFVDQPYLLREIGVSNPDPDFSDPADVAANLRSDNDVDTEEAVSGRLAARWSPADYVDGTLTYYFQDVDVGGRRISSQRLDYGDVGPNIIDPGPFDNAKRIKEPNNIRNELLALEVDFDLDFAKLTSATGLSRFQEDGNRDQNDLLISLEYSYELFPAFASQTLEIVETETLTQEVRLVSDYESRFNWIIGGFFAREEKADFSSEFTPNYDTFAINELGFTFLEDHPLDLEYHSTSYSQLEETALFGELGLDITDKWTVTVGGRYYEYELEGSTSVDFPLFDASFVPLSLDEIRLREKDPLLDQQDDGFLYKFNTAYDFTEDVLGYVTVSQGYRTGDSNGIGFCTDEDLLSGQQGACALATGQTFDLGPDGQLGTADDLVASIDERAYGPDKTTNYELGFKTAWNGGRFIFNGAIFFVEWEDPQVDAATINAGLTITVNAAAAESQGVELQSSWQVTDNFNIRGSYSYAQSELTETAVGLVRATTTEGGFGTVEIDGEPGDRLPGSPEQQFSIFGDYTMPLDDGKELIFRGGYNWQGDVLTRTGGKGGSVTVPEFGVANLSATYSADKWRASFFVNNLLDEYIETGFVSTPRNNQIVSDVNGSPVTTRSHFATLGAPRTFGIRLGYWFGK